MLTQAEKRADDIVEGHNGLSDVMILIVENNS